MKRTKTNRMMLAALLFLLACAQVSAQTDPLPSWNDSAAKKAIVEFVKTTTEKGSAKFVAPEARIAVFDQDGTTWVEQPMYTQVIYCLERVPAVVKAKPELANAEPFIHLMIGRRPVAAFGNSIGDKQMLEYTQAGDAARLMMLVHHDDDKREYAYGPKSKVGTFTDALMAQAKKNSWNVISMKNDWKRIFAFEK